MDVRTIEILNRFNESWNETMTIFNDLIENHKGFKHLIPIREFLEDLERMGGRKLYRLGTSLHTLIVSRSINHGLRIDQKYVKIEAIAENDFEVSMCDGRRKYRQYRVKELKETKVIRLIQTLKSLLID